MTERPVNLPPEFTKMTHYSEQTGHKARGEHLDKVHMLINENGFLIMYGLLVDKKFIKPNPTPKKEDK